MNSGDWGAIMRGVWLAAAVLSIGLAGFTGGEESRYLCEIGLLFFIASRTYRA